MVKNHPKIGWFFVIICVALSVLIGNLAYAQPGVFKPGSEPDGFRGIKWGQDISTVKGLIYAYADPSLSELDFYIRAGDEKKMGPAELEGIYYGFWRDKFYSVELFTKGWVNWINLKTVFFEKFGEGKEVDASLLEGFSEALGATELYVWGGAKAWILIDYRKDSEIGEFCIASMEIYTQIQEWMKQQLKEGVEKGW